jgi:hypothetical protein
MICYRVTKKPNEKSRLCKELNEVDLGKRQYAQVTLYGMLKANMTHEGHINCD